MIASRHPLQTCNLTRPKVAGIGGSIESRWVHGFNLSWDSRLPVRPAKRLNTPIGYPPPRDGHGYGSEEGRVEGGDPWRRLVRRPRRGAREADPGDRRGGRRGERRTGGAEPP